MGERFPGGIISKTPPTVTGPALGTSGTASGIWTLDEVLGYVQAGIWTGERIPIQELYTWGENDRGQLGIGDTARRSSPVQIGNLANWAQVSAGRFHTASVKVDGTLWTWGFNGQTSGRLRGQLGDSTNYSRSSPAQIGTLTNWAQVAAGGYHTAAVKTDGTLWTWGANGSSFFDGSGQLGTNDIETRFSPVQVGALSNWAQVSAGRFHTASIKTDGTLWTWGSNQNNTNNQPRGQLGDGTAASKSSPVQVGALTNWAQVSAGDYHTASIKTDGTLWTWGFNTQGVLGDGTTISRSSPVQIGSTDWAQVSTGAHTTATKTNGTLWAWGPNTDGQLGDGTGAGKSSPVQIGVLTNWSTAHAGGIHTASIKTDGTLWTWGRNNYGQLGDDTVASRSSPVQVGALTNWGQLSVGGSHNVAIAKS